MFGGKPWPEINGRVISIAISKPPRLDIRREDRNEPGLIDAQCLRESNRRAPRKPRAVELTLLEPRDRASIAVVGCRA